MKTLKEAGIGIGDFAAQLMESGAIKPEGSVEENPLLPTNHPSQPDNTVPDISKIEVPDNFVTEMTTCGSIGVNMAGPQADPMKDQEKTYKKKKKKEVEEMRRPKKNTSQANAGRDEAYKIHQKTLKPTRKSKPMQFKGGSTPETQEDEHRSAGFHSWSSKKEWKEAARNLLRVEGSGGKKRLQRKISSNLKFDRLPNQDVARRGSDKDLNSLRARQKHKTTQQTHRIIKNTSEAYSDEHPSMYDGASPNDVVNYLRGYRYAREPGPESPKEAGTEYFKKLTGAAHPDKETTAMEKKGKKQAWKNDQGQDNKFPSTLEHFLSKVETAVNEAVGITKPTNKLQEGLKKVRSKYGC